MKSGRRANRFKFPETFFTIFWKGGFSANPKNPYQKKMRSFGIFCQKEGGGSHPICRDVIGDIIHYFTFMSSKLTLFALFSIFRHYSLFFQKYENNVITLYTFQNFRLFSTISAGEIGSQGSWPLASCSQLRASSRERWAVCPSRPYLYGRARICVVQAQRVIELFGKKVNNALNVH